MSTPTTITYEKPQPPQKNLLQMLVRAVISLVNVIAVGVLHLCFCLVEQMVVVVVLVEF